MADFHLTRIFDRKIGVSEAIHLEVDLDREDSVDGADLVGNSVSEQNSGEVSVHIKRGAPQSSAKALDGAV